MSLLRHFCRRSTLAAAVPILALAAAAPPLLAQQPGVGGGTDSVGLEVLMRGPVHEGFAEPMGGGRDFLELPEPAPEPIEELPPAIRPTDEYREATWVPGYWGVEGETDEMVWVSGTWRYAPPNARWVPGYWATLDGGSVWVSGFWIDSSLERVEYLPPPPPVEDFEPAYDPPGENYFWVPGNYVWTGTQYVWEDGFWAEVQPNWVWTPARYLWTPRGYVYIPGYWDYPVERRGLLFAPVRVATTYRQVYRPTVAVNVSRALVHWFVRPNYRHYYFGNYYGDRYQTIGFTPWVAYLDRPTYYDPLYAYYRTTRVDFLQSLVASHRQIITGGPVRLPVSYSDYRRLAASSTQQTNLTQLTNFVQPVETLLEGEGEAQFEAIAERGGGQLEQVREQIEATRRFARGRLDAEINADTDLSADARLQVDRGEGRRTAGERGERARATDPSATDPAGTDPATTDPTTTDPTTTDPTTTDPTTTDPTTTDPTTTDPATTDPAITAPTTTDPAEPRDRAPQATRPGAGERGQASEQPGQAGERGQAGEQAGQGRGAEAAARARGSFDLPPFAGGQQPGQRRGDAGEGARARDGRPGAENTNPLDAAERGTDAAGDAANAARDALDQRRQPGDAAARGGASAQGQLRGQADAYRPPPRLDGRGQRGREVRPGGARGAAGNRGAEQGLNPGAPGRGADRERPNPARRPGAGAGLDAGAGAAIGGGASPAAEAGAAGRAAARARATSPGAAAGAARPGAAPETVSPGAAAAGAAGGAEPAAASPGAAAEEAEESPAAPADEE